MASEEEQPKDEGEAEDVYTGRIAIKLGAHDEEGEKNLPVEQAEQEEDDEEGYAVDGVTLDDVFEVVCGMEEVFETVKAPLARIEEGLLARLNADKSKDKAFDTLYEEMRQYKENFLHKAQKPLFLDLILLYDQVIRGLESVSEDAGKEAIENIKEELLEILYRRDVEPMEFEEGSKFDRVQMKAIKRVETDNEEQDKDIERVSRCGFKWDETILRPHEVVVKRFGKINKKDEK